MFLPVPYKLAQNLRCNGKMELRALSTSALFQDRAPGISAVRAMITFRNNPTDSNALVVFKCELSKPGRIMVFSDLRQNDLVVIDESTIHFHLGLFIEHAEKWAREAGKNIVIVESRLQHIAEWFIEYDWNIVDSDSFGPEKGHRGTKTLLEKTTTK